MARTLLFGFLKSEVDFETCTSNYFLPTTPLSKFDLTSTRSVEVVCGKMGVIKPPIYYLGASPFFGWVFLYVENNFIVGYAALRLDTEQQAVPTCVIDVFGIVLSHRKTGAGRTFFEDIMHIVNGNTQTTDRACPLLIPGHPGSIMFILHKLGYLNLSNGLTVSLQSTYEYDSFVIALKKHTQMFHSTTQDVIHIDWSSVCQELKGSCNFWTKMGFDHKKLVLVNNCVLDPILLMWFKPLCKF